MKEPERKRNEKTRGIIDQISNYSRGNFNFRVQNSDSDDEFSGIIEALNDLGQKFQQQASKAVEIETKYRNLFHNNPMPMWVLELPSLRFLDVNDAAMKQYGYTRDEFLSMTATDIRPDEEKERFLNLDRTTTGTHNAGHWKHRRKDGSILYVEVFAHEIDFAGKRCRLILSIDITERKKVEEALRISEARFRGVFDSKLIGFYFWSREGKITDANDFFLQSLGYSRQEFIEGNVIWKNINPPEYADVDKTILTQVLTTGVSEPVEKEYIHKDGSRLPVLVGAALLNQSEGVAYVLDIGQRKKMEEEILQLNRDLEQRIAARTEQLQVVNKELESFSYTVSHDLRAPLRAIIGYSQMLLEDYENTLDKEAIRLINTVTFNARRMGQLVDDLLEFSRMGKRELKATPVDMTAVVKNVIKDINLSDKELSSITINELGTAYADPALMHHVFQNLILNAVKYASKKKDPMIEVGVKETEGTKVYFVQDNGAGFDMAYYNKLFGVFQRLHRQDEFEGTGVGLAIVHRIITRHGGKIWAEGKVNEGATFYFTLTS